MSKTKGNAAFAAMEAVTQAREAPEVYEQKSQEASEAGKLYNCAIMRTFEKTDALEKHVHTVTMRAESLPTTEADFSKRFSNVKRRRSEISTNSVLGCARIAPDFVRRRDASSAVSFPFFLSVGSAHEQRQEAAFGGPDASPPVPLFKPQVTCKSGGRSTIVRGTSVWRERTRERLKSASCTMTWRTMVGSAIDLSLVSTILWTQCANFMRSRCLTPRRKRLRISSTLRCASSRTSSWVAGWKHC